MAGNDDGFAAITAGVGDPSGIVEFATMVRLMVDGLTAQGFTVEQALYFAANFAASAQRGGEPT
jgi:hypothetical protein